MFSLLLLFSLLIFWIAEKDDNELLGVATGGLSVIFIIAIICGLMVIGENFEVPEQLQECQETIQELETKKESIITNFTQNITEKELTNQELEECMQNFNSDLSVIEKQINQKQIETIKLEQDVKELNEMKFWIYFGGK